MSETAVRELVTTDELLTAIQDQLRKQAYLYESPHDFRAGVDAVINAVVRETSREALLAELDDLDDFEIDLTR
jgi:hypothetical protein